MVRRLGAGNDPSIARTSGRHADRKRGAPTESERYFSHGWLKDGGRYPRNAGFGNSSNPKSREEFSRSSARNLGIAVLPWSAQRRHSEASKDRRLRWRPPRPIIRRCVGQVLTA